MINQIFMPSLASGACTMSDRGSPIAVPGVAAGGYNNNSHKQHRASTLIKAGRLALPISQWLLQIELIFRLLLKITVEEPHACDLTYLCPPRGGTIQEAFGGWTLAVWVTSQAVPGFDSEVKLYHDVVQVPSFWAVDTNLRPKSGITIPISPLLTVAQLVERGTVNVNSRYP